MRTLAKLTMLTGFMAFLLIGQGQLNSAFAGDDPDDVVEDLYDAYDDNETPGVLADEHLVRRYFTARLAGLILAGRGRPGFDPIVDAQDWKISHVDIDEKGERDGVVVIEAKFRNFGEKKRVGYALVMEDGVWRIDDIASENAQGRWVLSRLLTH